MRKIPEERTRPDDAFAEVFSAAASNCFCGCVDDGVEAGGDVGYRFCPRTHCDGVKPLKAIGGKVVAFVELVVFVAVVAV